MIRSVLALAATLLLPGCTTEQWVPYAYDIPIAHNSHGPERALACIAACHAASSEESPAFFSCLRTCPDAHVVENAECEGPPTQESACYTELVARDVYDPQMTESFLDALGSLLEVGAAVADASSSHHEHHEHHHSGGSHHESHHRK